MFFSINSKCLVALVFALGLSMLSISLFFSKIEELSFYRGLPNTMLELSNLGYVGMCISAFLAATILPFSSEIVLVTLLNTGANKAYLLLAASMGNILGALVNYVLGWRYGETFALSWLGIKQRTFLRAQQMFKKWGKWSLLLCWVPIIGDPLTLMGGILRTRFWFFLSVVACTKTLRYGAIMYYFF